MTRRRVRTAGVVLAAGLGRRFGANKLLARLHGKALVRRVVEAALASRLDPVVVVLGHHAEQVRDQLCDLLERGPLEVVLNPCYRQGQSTSVVAGLNAVQTRCAAAVFLMGDQPLVDAALIDRLISAHEISGKGICLPRAAGQRRTPVLFAATYFPSILSLAGDVGARGLIDAHRDDTLSVACTDDRRFRDVDTRAELADLEREQEWLP